MTAPTTWTTWEAGMKPSPSARNEDPTVSEILGSRHNCRHHGFARTPIFSCSLNMGFWFPGGAGLKNLPANAGDTRDEDEVLVPGSGRYAGVGNGNPFQYFLPGIFCGQRSLVGYSLWGHKALDMTEQLRTSTKHGLGKAWQASVRVLRRNKTHRRYLFGAWCLF